MLGLRVGDPRYCGARVTMILRNRSSLRALSYHSSTPAPTPPLSLPPSLAIRDYWDLGKEGQKDNKYVVLVSFFPGEKNGRPRHPHTSARSFDSVRWTAAGGPSDARLGFLLSSR